MIDGETKQKLLQEIEKVGNVYSSCLKIGVNKATYYRWKKEDKEFSKLASRAEKTGRENMCDIAEHALMQNVKERKMDAIKYALAHNSTRYKPKIRKVIIEHSQSGERKEEVKQMQKEHWDQINDAYNGIIELIRSPVMNFTTEETKKVLEKLPDVGAKIDDSEYADEPDVLLPGEPTPDPAGQNNGLDDELASKIVLDLPEDNDE